MDFSFSLMYCLQNQAKMHGHKGQVYVRSIGIQVRILTLILFYTFTYVMKNFATLKEARKWRRRAPLLKVLQSFENKR